MFESSLWLDRTPLGFGHPRLSGTVSAISPDEQKDHLLGGLSVCWWRRREFESSLSLDRPPLRSGHPRLIGAGSAVTAAKTKKGHPADDPFPFLVEAAGVEPASASTLPLALHA